MHLRVYQIGSGSSGNATAFVGEDGGVLVDTGFSAKDAIGRMRYAGLDPAELRAIIVTHCHGDHAGGVAVLARKLDLPVWATAPTLEALPNLRGNEELHEIAEHGTTRIGGLTVDTLPVSHDVAGTVILRFDERVAIATDLGVAGSEVRDFLSGLDGLLLEFNHDVDMLMEGAYPAWLKARVRSDAGHLSNAQAGELLLSPRFRLPRQALWLCHLSRHNNLPELALVEAECALDGAPIRVVMTQQHRPAEAVVLA
jgi:phosphoribosyl 1,2-cyclic phosphodiesterase